MAAPLRRHWRGVDGDALAAALDAARTSVGAFADVTSRSGSLLQSWIRGRPVVQFDHYPPGDVIDLRSGCQFYYHSHRGGDVEHGHLHLFWHATRSGRRRRPRHGRLRWVRTAPTHLFAVALDARGLPVGLFTVNRWVTEGHWFDASTTLSLVDRFRLHAVKRHGASCRWLTAFVRLYRPMIEALLLARDARLQRRGDPSCALDDRRLEVLSFASIDWAADLDALEAEAQRRAPAGAKRRGA